MDNNWEAIDLNKLLRCLSPLNQSCLIEWRGFYDCLRSRIPEIQDSRPQQPHSSYVEMDNKWEAFWLNKQIRWLSPLNQGWLIEWTGFHDCLRSRVPEIQDDRPPQPHSSYKCLKWKISFRAWQSILTLPFLDFTCLHPASSDMCLKIPDKSWLSDWMKRISWLCEV